MWIGFAIPFLVGSLNALHHYFPSVPKISLNTSVSFLGANLPANLNFLMLGFSFLINSTLSLSLWFFLLVYTLQQHVLGLLGINTLQATLGPWSTPVTGHQMMGALIVMVGAGLWVGRHHLAEVWRQALSKKDSGDDADEIMSYRSALLGLLVGTACMTLWLWQSGIPAWVAPLFVFAALVIFIGLTRAIVEAGIPTLSPAMVPLGFVVSGVGVPALGAKGMVAAAYSLIWVGELLVFMMAPLSNGLRLTSETAGNRRRLLWGIVGAMFITLAVSIYYTLHLAYDYGGVNLHNQFFGQSFPSYPSRFALRKLSEPSGVSVDGWLWTLSGGLVMAPPHDRPPAPDVVALPPAGFCRQRRVDHALYMVLHLFGLADQTRHPALRRRWSIPQDPPLFSRPDRRSIRHRRSVAGHRRVHRHRGQCHSGDVLTLLKDTLFYFSDGVWSLASVLLNRHSRSTINRAPRRNVT